jgi:hypothetical protein
MARDKATRDIVVGCDLFGLAAETSVLVPLERAAQLGLRADAFFQQPSRTLKSGGWAPDPPAIGLRGVKLSQISGLHGKLAWDEAAVAITSTAFL